MTHAQLTRATHTPIFHWIARRLRGLAESFLRAQARRATRDILRSLEHRTLKDIGIHPDEIESIVYGERNDRRRRYDADWTGRLPTKSAV
jgi:uncharacterized protein YjiS (DUF1127 family)